MANVENRAAEHGSVIISDTEEHTFQSGKPAVAIRILEPTVISAIESNHQYPTLGIEYYVGKTLDIDNPVILGNITKIQLSSGAVQALAS